MWERLKQTLIGLVAGFWAVLSPIHTILYVVFALVLADMVTGIFKAWRLKQPITSNRLRDTAVKLVPYLLVLLAGFGLDTITAIPGLYFVRAFALLIASTETMSLGENLRDITGLDIGTIIRAKLKPPTDSPPPTPPAGAP